MWCDAVRCGVVRCVVMRLDVVRAVTCDATCDALRLRERTEVAYVRHFRAFRTMEGKDPQRHAHAAFTRVGQRGETRSAGVMRDAVCDPTRHRALRREACDAMRDVGGMFMPLPFAPDNAEERAPLA